MTQQPTPLPTTDQSSLWVLPPTWGTKKLSALAVEDSKQIKPSNNPTQTYNYWGLDAIDHDQFQEPDPNYVSGSTIDSTCVEFNESHVLYSKLRPYLNKVIVPSLGGIGTTEWIVIQPNQSLITRKYIAYMLRTKTFVHYATKNSHGARMPRMRKEALWNFDVPLPYPDDPSISLHIQHAIVARVESLLAELRKIRDLHNVIDRDVAQVMKSALIEVFSELELRFPADQCIGEFAEVKSGGTPDRGHQEYYQGTIPWIKTGELKDNVIYESEEQISETAVQNSNAKKVPAGTLLVAMYGQGQTRGRTGLLAIEATTNQACCAILPNDDVFIPRYLQYWFMYMYEELRNQSEARGGNQSNLNARMIKNLQPPLPDKGIQQQIGAYLQEIHSEILEMQDIQLEDNALLGQIEQAILEQAFRGEV